MSEPKPNHKTRSWEEVARELSKETDSARIVELARELELAFRRHDEEVARKRLSAIRSETN